MTSKTFVSGTVIDSDWLNDVDTKTYADTADTVAYTPAGTGAVATTVQSKLRESVSVKDFGAVGDGVADDTDAIQRAIDFATLAGSPKVVYLPSGTYLISSRGSVVIPAHDDGTGTKTAYNGTTTTNIAAETTSSQAYCLSIPSASSVVLQGDGQTNTILKGTYSSGASLSYPIGIAITGGSLYQWGGIHEIGFQNLFIGLSALDALLVESSFSKLLFKSCGICILTRYLERNTFSKIHFFGVGTGHINGGFWTQRADQYAEPGGWADKNTFEEITGQSFYPITSDNFAAIDTYFDTYFFKTGNNTTRKYPSGGSGTPATAQPYKGIAGYTLAMLSRYYRPNTSNVIGNLVHMGSSRPALQLKGIGVIDIASIYLEQVGYANAGASGDVVGDGVYDDPYHVGRYKDLVANGIAAFGGVTIGALDINSGCAALTCQPYDFHGELTVVRDSGSSSVPLPASASNSSSKGLTCRAGNLVALAGYTKSLQNDITRFSSVGNSWSGVGTRQYYFKYAPATNFQNHTFSSSTAGDDETITPAGFVMGDGSCTLRFELRRGTYRHCSGSRLINRSVGTGESVASVSTLGTDVSTVTGGANGVTVTIDATTGVLTFACTSGLTGSTQPFELYLVLEGSGLAAI